MDVLDGCMIGGWVDSMLEGIHERIIIGWMDGWTDSWLDGFSGGWMG